MIIKKAVFWDVDACRRDVSRRFGGKYPRHFHGNRKNMYFLGFDGCDFDESSLLGWSNV
jgi:hypothetical protein